MKPNPTIIRTSRRIAMAAAVIALAVTGTTSASAQVPQASSAGAVQTRAVPAASIGGVDVKNWKCWKSLNNCVKHSKFPLDKRYWDQDMCTRGVNCSNYVAYRLQKAGLYNFVGKCSAGSGVGKWDESARKCKHKLITVDKKPEKGAVLHFDVGAKKPAPDVSGTYTAAHVAYIDGITGGYVYVSEAQCGDKMTKRYKVKLTTLQNLINNSGGKIEVIHNKRKA